ncbi:MAG: hypothetical protein VB144_03500, partial [Clostridia bacterium]|nr:hypothetical protein [Clostridia bacterium]
MGHRRMWDIGVSSDKRALWNASEDLFICPGDHKLVYGSYAGDSGIDMRSLQPLEPRSVEVNVDEIDIETSIMSMKPALRLSKRAFRRDWRHCAR